MGVLAVTSLVMAGCNAPSKTAVSATKSSFAVLANQGYLSPSSQCSANAPFLTQSLSGALRGCFRVPTTLRSSLVVALSTYLLNSGSLAKVPTTTSLAPAPNVKVSLDVSSHTVVPGQRVGIVGTYHSPPPVPRATLADLCWDGCRGGLVESLQLHWTSPRTFRTSFVVPDTAWLESDATSVSIHPLRSGVYRVGLQCLGAVEGCAEQRANAYAIVHVLVTHTARCVRRTSCAWIHLSSTHGPAGSEVVLRGWAPVESIIGQPFGYDLSVSVRSAGATRSDLSYWASGKGGGYLVALAPKIFKVSRSETWSDLGRVGYATSSWSSLSPIDALTGSDRTAWCQESGVAVTSGSSVSTFPTHSAGLALRGSSLTLFPSSTGMNPTCSTVQLDPRYDRTVYAGFGAAMNDSAPPTYVAGLYSVDAGATWRLVPSPAGTSSEDFAGFARDGNEIVALFSSTSNGAATQRDAPVATANGVVPVEVTSNGGATWSSSTLGCAGTGPCVRFGPYTSGNCAMNASAQALLLGPASSRAGSDVRWTTSSWISSVNSCYTQQLVVSSHDDLYLIDPSSSYPLLESMNGGATWNYRALPRLAHAPAGLDAAPFSESLVLARDGSMFAVAASHSGQGQELFRLYPRAHSWCQVRHAFASPSPGSSYVVVVRTDGSNLLWLETQYSTSGSASQVSRHDVSLDRLVC